MKFAIFITVLAIVFLCEVQEITSCVRTVPVGDQQETVTQTTVTISTTTTTACTTNFCPALTTLPNLYTGALFFTGDQRCTAVVKCTTTAIVDYLAFDKAGVEVYRTPTEPSPIIKDLTCSTSGFWTVEGKEFNQFSC
uniref:C6 domain-containing protein n=1 Tax=Plectus sambesii TaxID=2011161 RepID=A0A914UNY8_9BILA